MSWRVAVLLFLLVGAVGAAPPPRALVPVDGGMGSAPGDHFDAPPPAPRAGEYAPDFELPTFDGTKVMRLSSHRGARPVVLVFGSYT